MQKNLAFAAEGGYTRSLVMTEKKPGRLISVLAVLAILVVMAVWLVAIIWMQQFDRGTLEKWALASTVLGGLSALFAGVTFIIAAEALRLQANQFKSWMRSLAENTKHQTETLEAMRAQADALISAAKCNGLAAYIKFCEQQKEFHYGHNQTRHRFENELEYRARQLNTVLDELGVEPYNMDEKNVQGNGEQLKM